MRKAICIILAVMGVFWINMNVHAEEYDEEWDYTEEYEDYEDYGEESEEYIEESYYEEESVTEEISVTEESVTEEISVAEESVTEQPSEISKEESVSSAVSKAEESVAEKSEISKVYEPKVLNVAMTAEKEDNNGNSVSGMVMWGIVFLLMVVCIIFIPRESGISSIKDRYRYRKAKKISERHIR